MKHCTFSGNPWSQRREPRVPDDLQLLHPHHHPDLPGQDALHCSPLLLQYLQVSEQFCKNSLKELDDADGKWNLETNNFHSNRIRYQTSEFENRFAIWKTQYLYKSMRKEKSYFCLCPCLNKGYA